MKRFATLLLICIAFAKIQAQENPIQVTLYWDVSYSMQERNLEGEFDVLDRFFKSKKQATVSYIAFSNTITAREQHTIKDGDWESLKSSLKAAVYDGSTDFNLINFTSGAQHYILSSDGHSVYNELTTKSAIPVTVIQSIASDKTTRLKLLGNISRGGYFDAIPVTTTADNAAITGTVTGVIGDVVGPISNVSVKVDGSDKGTVTDENGAFKIDVQCGAVLTYSYVGKKTKRVRISDKKVINLNLDYTDESLDEVVLTSKKEDENVINTGYGKIKKDQLGYDVKSIGDEDVKDINTDVTTAVQGKFAGVTVSPTKGLSRAQIRTVQTIFGNTNPLIVIDGIPTVQRNSSSGPAGGTGGGIQDSGIEDLINPEDIADITILKSHAATNKYGTLGVNGVILITSKTGQKAKEINNGGGKAKPIGTTATYSGNAEGLSALADTSYITALKASQSVDDAYDKYLQQRNTYGDRAEFYLDVADYFKGWNNQFIINRVLSNVLEVAVNDASMLRALAYKYESLGQQQEASKIYKYIYELNARNAQGYRDLALSYAHEGKIEEASSIYQQIASGASGQASFTAIQESLTKEIRNFVRKNKAAITTTVLSTNYNQEVGKLYKRIVIEWNDPRAEFDLQIVNPQKRYFTWSHTQKEAYQRLASEANEGFNMEEFFLTDGDKGQWAFNVVNYGFTDGDQGQPVYIKFTVYTNFGTPQEQKEVKLVRLSEIDKELNVLTISV